ncbi:cytochrome P450 [Amycolatopsis sp. WAC 04197]|uniref:cytochrome P450 n=1 Tax=Amycolatopsis sp. WAC 04197 TaxID=2203199 RepID=UPI0013151197|nr:cytochrome P450 [Amycolatopsis sp. WAC 04197]
MTVTHAPGAVPLIGHLPQLLRAPEEFIASLPEHGDIVQIMLGTQPTYVICRPDLAEQVLVNRNRVFDKGGPFFDSVGEFLGDGLASCPDAGHTRMRRLVQPAFRRTRIPFYSDTIADQLQEVTAGWRDGQIVDTVHDMQQLSMRFVVNTMFAGWAAEGAEAEQRTRAAVETLVRGAFVRMVLPWFGRLPLPNNWHYAAAKRRLYERIDATVAEYRRDGTDRGDLLSMLTGRDEHGDGLSDEEIRDQAVTFFIAGIGTTAATLSWTLYFLSRDSTLDTQIAEEVHQARPTGPIGYDDAGSFPLLRRTISESMRIKPVAWMYTRKAIADSELAGHRIPSGMGILVSPYLLQHRADAFADPERFDVCRWSEQEDVRFRGAPMFPFGKGARRCIGDEFAINNIIVTLATLLRQWRLEPMIKGPVTSSARSMLEPKALRLRLRARRWS